MLAVAGAAILRGTAEIEWPNAGAWEHILSQPLGTFGKLVLRTSVVFLGSRLWQDESW